MNADRLSFRPVAQSQWRPLALAALLILAGVALNALKPWPLKLLVDSVLPGRPFPQGFGWIGALPGGESASARLAWIAAASVLIVAAAWVCQTVQAVVQSRAGNRMTYDLGARLFDHLQRLSLRFHARRPAGDLVRRVTKDCGCVRELVLGVYVPALTSLATLAILFAIMWSLDPWLTLIALGVVLPLAAIVRFCLGPMTERTYEQQQLEGQRMALVERTLTAIPAVQAFGAEGREDENFRELSQHTLRAYLRAVAAQLRFGARVEGTMAVGTALIMVLGGLHVLEGRLTVGGLLVFLAYLTALYAPLSDLAQLSSGFASAAAGARRVREILSIDDRPVEAPHAVDFARSSGERGHVRFEDVTFGYEPGRPVLHDVSFEAHPGELVALVGETGAGKTTLVSLLPRLFDPWDGRVLIDRLDVRSLTLASLRADVSLVLQEPVLLPLSIAENIAYGRPDLARRRIEAAALAAHADEFIRKLPDGYDTVIGQRGATLSAGQRQRLAIARALARDAAVVILDEPTSAVDAATEALLMESIEHLTRNRTTFVIAHRLSTVRRADRILVLDAGRIIEAGTHAGLWSADGAYRRLCDTQLGVVPGVTARSTLSTR
jgi:ATP-binding cassette, subfamily B, bacterial